MLPCIHFSEFDPDDALKFEAQQSLEEILELAPEGTLAIAKLEKVDECFRCAVDLYSKRGPFIARTFQPTPLLALHHARQILRGKLLRIRAGKTRSLDRKKSEPILAIDKRS